MIKNEQVPQQIRDKLIMANKNIEEDEEIYFSDA